jgi:membrane protein implicated in regulation of membrane protease activity
MNTLFLVCFLVGLSLSVVSFSMTHFNLHLGHHHGPGHHGPRSRLSIFNMAALTAFLTWFGGAGLLLQQVTQLATPPLVGAALVSGVAGGSVINRFLRSLARSERPLEASTIIGKVAQITSPIRAGGTGEVVYSLHGTRHAEAARAESGAAIDKGTQVVIVRHEKGIAYVSTWDEL